MRKWGVVLAVVGVLLIAGAAVLRFVVVPAGQALPADTDEQIAYTGTLTAIDPAALESGDVGASGASEVPVRVDRRLTVLETAGDDARVRDASVVTATETGDTVSRVAYVYTVDRRTMHAVPNFTDEPAEDAEGLVIGFPIGSEKVNYVGWVQDVEQTAHVKYEGERDVNGLPAYEYGGEFSTEVPASELPGAPSSLPKEQLAGLVETLDLPAELGEQLADALPLLPASIPLTYTYGTVDSYTVEPTTGIIVDLTKTTTTSVGVEGFADVQLPVVETTVGYTPENVANEVQRAQDALDMLELYGTTIPLVLLVLGVLALGISVPMMRRRRTGETPPAPTERPTALTG